MNNNEFLHPLPSLMVAPNGARRGKTDHPALPISIAETVETAQTCVKAGANGLHLHVRDSLGQHTLDTGLYSEALEELKNAIPSLPVQITTEAVGVYTPEQQRTVVTELHPESVSVSLAEMLADNDRSAASGFYGWCLDQKIALQHILYGSEDLKLLGDMLADESIPVNGLQLMFVLGRYTKGQQSTPDDLVPYLHWLEQNAVQADWAICAFGVQETECLVAAHNAGGKVRVGFENSLWHADGSLAIDNADRVREVRSQLDA